MPIELNKPGENQLVDKKSVLPKLEAAECAAQMISNNEQDISTYLVKRSTDPAF